jgi:hypothetical protein
MLRDQGRTSPCGPVEIAPVAPILAVPSPVRSASLSPPSTAISERMRPRRSVSATRFRPGSRPYTSINVPKASSAAYRMPNSPSGSSKRFRSVLPKKPGSRPAACSLS